jgi:N-acetylglucosaminyl-diphospho-decaprenol L-rhamnosyltransferase
MSADFDVVIVAYRSRDTISSCVDDARRLSGVGEVVVVDHGDDGADAVARDAGARVLTDRTNPGFGAGQNRGVAATSAPYALLLNPDAVPDDAGTQAGLRVLRENAAVGAVQGMITNRTTGMPERSQGREIGPLHLFGRAVGARRLLRSASVRALGRRVGVLADHVDRVPAKAESVASLAATAILVRRRAFDEVNGFDEAYFLYGEDLDLCRRLRATGWTLMALPERSAWHENGSSAATDTERELTWWCGTMRYSARWWSSAAWCIALLASTVQWCRLAAREPPVARRAWRALVAEPLRDRRLR